MRASAQARAQMIAERLVEPRAVGQALGARGFDGERRGARGGGQGVYVLGAAASATAGSDAA